MPSEPCSDGIFQYQAASFPHSETFVYKYHVETFAKFPKIP
ncbi:hypothetical protein [Neisseria meningitidis]|nr:hypothetical protein [Neisseria meningitidis]